MCNPLRVYIIIYLYYTSGEKFACLHSLEFYEPWVFCFTNSLSFYPVCFTNVCVCVCVCVCVLYCVYVLYIFSLDFSACIYMSAKALLRLRIIIHPLTKEYICIQHCRIISLSRYVIFNGEDWCDLIHSFFFYCHYLQDIKQFVSSIFLSWRLMHYIHTRVNSVL